jgi:RNA polymerase-binding transcription factor DksA
MAKAVRAKNVKNAPSAPKKGMATSRAKAPAAKSAPAKPATTVKATVTPRGNRVPAKAASAAKKAPAKSAAPAKAPRAKAAPGRTKAAKAAPVKATAMPRGKQAAPAKKTAPAKAAPAKAAPAKAAPAKAAPAKKKSTVTCPLSGFEVKPDKPNLSPRTLERLQTKLLEERARHVHQADEFQAEAEALAIEREGGDTQFDEESGEGDTVNVERERDLLLSASARQIVDEIDRALERIKDGAYGVCVPAGRRISLERLEALPYADTCVECKARAERRR